MKYLSTCIFTLFILLNACKSDNDNPIPPAEPPVSNPDMKLKRNSKTVNIFLQVSSTGRVTPLKESEIADYFGERIAFSIPEEIIVTKDSTSMVKPYGIIEKFKSKWEKEQLFIQIGDQEQWKLLGEKSKDTAFKLSMSFYAKKTGQIPATKLVVGQEYNMNTYASLISNADQSSTLTWLKFDLLYN